MVIRWIFLTTLPLLAFANDWIDTKDNETLPLDVRHPRVTGRIVKLYSGTRPEPVYCSNEGFQADPADCSVFYRCVRAHNGKYNVFRFQCGPGTVYDPDTEVCNHPQSTKRTECGGRIQPVEVPQSNQQINENEIEGQQSELPSPISTRKPDYGTSTSRVNPGIQTARTTAYPWPTAVTQQTSPPSQSGSKNYPLCTADGFMGDTENCRTFYRCVGNTRGGFIRYEFQCSETTIWDDDAQSCNHAWAVQRSRCGRSNGYSSDDKTFFPATKTTKKDQTSTTSSGSQTTQDPITTSASSSEQQTTTTTDNPTDQQTSSSNSNNPAIQQQVQVNYGSKVTQTQSQISNNGPVIQNQTQINYGDKNNKKQDVKQNQTQISQGSAVSQTQTQINYGEKTVQSQSQIDHTQQASQTQTSESEFSTTKPSSPDEEDNEPDNGYNNQPSNLQPGTDSSHSNGNGNMGKECKESGFMGDPNDCRKFYRCVDNGKGGYTKYEFTCGEGTVWDASIEGCNHAWAVPNCGGSGQSSNQESNQTTTQSPQSTTTKKSTQKPTTESTTTDDGNDEDNGYGNQNPEPSDTTSSTTTTRKPQEQTTSTESSTSSGNIGNECTSSGFMGDDNDCKKFYRCVDNGRGSFTKYEFKCGEGTVWDPEIEACNHAWAVSKCGGSSTDVHKVDETTTSKQTTAAQAVTQTTPQGPGEDTDSDYDNGYGQSSNEPSTSSTTTKTTTTTKKPQSSSSDRSECQESGFMGDKNDCKKFYRCVDNGRGGFTRYEFTCGEGTAWDQSIEACNHEELVEKCGGSGGMSPGTDTQSETTTGKSQESTTEKVTKTTSIPSQTTTSTQTTQHKEPTKKPEPSKECSQEGFMGDPDNCKKFYRCVDNGKGGFTKYEFECGEGTVWDSEIDSCNHPSSGNCGKSGSQEGQMNENAPQPNVDSDEMVTEEGTSTTTTTTTASRPPTTESIPSETVKPQPESTGKCSSEGFYANPDDCRKFYRCVDNGKGGYTKYDFSCGEGTVWVQEIQACDHDSDGTCKQSSSVTQSPPSGQEQQATTESSSADQSSTTTSSTSTSSQTQNPNEQPSEKPSPSGSSEECTSEGFYGNKEDCRKFYRCVDNGKGGFTKYDFDCGEGTAWDSEIESCNHIDQVESCKGSEQSGKPQEGQGESESNQEQDQTKPNEEQEQTKPSEEQEQTKPALQDEQPSQSSDSTTSSPSDGSSGSQQSQSSSKATCDQEGYFGNPDDCKKFYRCVDNGKGGFTKYDFDCGEGTIWDQDLTTCNHPQDVQNPSCKQSQSGGESSEGSSSTSSSSTTSTTSSSSQSETTSSTTESSSSGSSNCSQENSSKKPDNKGYDCPQAGYYADPNDCKKFYRCVDWEGDGKKYSIYHFECGEGTIWDPALDTCNHEESVYPPRDCSGSQSQSENATEENTTQKSTTEQSTTEKSTTQEQTTSQQTEKTTTEQTTTQESTTQEQTEATTHKQTEATTQKQTEGTTQEQTEATTQEQTEATTQKQTEATTQEQTEATTQKQTEGTTQEQTEATTQEQTEATTQKQTEATTQEQTEATTQKQTDGTTQEQTEATTQEQTEATTSQQQTTTQEQTEATTQEQTEQTTAQQTTTQQSSTQESTEQTTQESTTEQSSTDESTTQESTTQQQSTTSQSSESTEQTTTEGGGSTTESSSTTESNSSGDKECPETEDDQNVFVCPTSFRRHPKYCNMFYQCTEDDDTHEVKIATFKCPNNTIYDENQTKCVEEDKAEKKCDGEMAQKRRFKRLDAYSKEPIFVTNERLKCPATGHYPFEKEECSPAFLKCQKSKSGSMRGQVYRCPEGFVYWSVSRRCESKPKMRDCKHTVNDWSNRWEIPIERRNVAPIR